MLQTYTSGETNVQPGTPLFDFVDTDGCCMHPKRRRIRHLRSIHFKDLSVDLSKQVQKDHEGDTVIYPETQAPDLLDLYTDKFYNVFFSMHTIDEKGDEKCIYISEVIERTINPNFQEFNFTSHQISRLTSFVLKVWISTFKSPKDWNPLFNIPINLSNLVYLNKELDNVPSFNNNNTILMALFDGIYTLPTKEFDMSEYKAMIYDDYHIKNITKTVPSFTYDSIMKINNLNRNIEDMTNSKRKTSKTIDVVFDEEYYDDSLSNHHFELNRINNMIQQSVAYLQLQKTKLQELKELQENKLKFIAKFKQNQVQNKDNLVELKQEFSELLTLNENVRNDLILLKNEKIKELVNIFPKNEIYEWLKIPKSSTFGSEYQFLEFLPIELNLNALTNLINISDQSLINQINAGFGYIAEIVLIASRYLGIPLRYQIRPFGSSSYVVDNISQIHQRKTFPLFYTDHFYRFQYAVILLNRNIQDILKEESLIHY